MVAREFDDQTLMAFADGELDDETAAAIEQAMQTTEDLARQVALFLETGAQANEALRLLLEEPVPEALGQSVRRMIDQARLRGTQSSDSEAARVVAFKARGNQAIQHPGRSWLMPLAASLAATVFGMGGYFLGTGAQHKHHGLQVAGLDNSALSQPLGRLAAGEEAILTAPAERIRVVA